MILVVAAAFHAKMRFCFNLLSGDFDTHRPPRNFLHLAGIPSACRHNCLITFALPVPIGVRDTPTYFGALPMLLHSPSARCPFGITPLLYALALLALTQFLYTRRHTVLSLRAVFIFFYFARHAYTTSDGAMWRRDIASRGRDDAVFRRCLIS